MMALRIRVSEGMWRKSDLRRVWELRTWKLSVGNSQMNTYSFIKWWGNGEQYCVNREVGLKNLNIFSGGKYIKLLMKDS